MNTVIENILSRRSVRSFKAEQISAEDLDLILQAGSYAPNGMGLQSWKFTAVQNKNVIDKINQGIRKTLLTIPIVPETHPFVISLIEKSKNEDAEFLYHAPTYIIVSNLKENGNAASDSALAIGNMMLAAHSLGIGSCWLHQLPGLTHMPTIRELLTDLDIPEDHIVYGAVAMGYAKEEARPAAPRKDVIHIIR